MAINAPVASFVKATEMTATTKKVATAYIAQFSQTTSGCHQALGNRRHPPRLVRFPTGPCALESAGSCCARSKDRGVPPARPSAADSAPRARRRQPMTKGSRNDPPGMAESDVQLSRWGGTAALAGVATMVVTVGVVVGAGLPDASDAETLTDFAAIESGPHRRHFLYLGAVVLFAIHVAALRRLLRRAHPAASLFGEVVAMFGLVIMAASSLLHISTSPLADLYESQEATPADQRAIEYCGTQRRACSTRCSRQAFCSSPSGSPCSAWQCARHLVRPSTCGVRRRPRRRGTPWRSNLYC